MSDSTYEVAIIGAGPGGVSAAHLLRSKGITNFVILERAADFGGTWRDNHYPGLAVDIPALWYQLSFAPNAGWSRFSRQDQSCIATYKTPRADSAFTNTCKPTPKSSNRSGTTTPGSGG